MKKIFFVKSYHKRFLNNTKKIFLRVRMPYHLQQSGKGYYVITTSTGRKHSDKPISKAKAEAQMRVLEMSDRKKRKK
jgi:hypothetical protein